MYAVAQKTLLTNTTTYKMRSIKEVADAAAQLSEALVTRELYDTKVKLISDY